MLRSLGRSPRVLLALALLPGAASGLAGPRFERFDAEPGLAQQQIRCGLQDHRGFLWFCTDDGLARYDGYRVVVHQPGIEKNSIAHHDVRALVAARDGNLWIAMDGGGVDRLDPARGTFTHFRHDPRDPTSLSSDRAISLFEDPAGDLWVGTDGDGVNRLDPVTGAFVHYRHDPADPSSLSHDTAYAIRADRSGTLWVGTDGGGLNRFDAATGTFARYRHDPEDPTSLSHDRVHAILPAGPGELWIGTYGGGLDRFDVDRGAFEHVPLDVTTQGAGMEVVRVLHLDEAGQSLWIGTYGGMARHDLTTGETRYHRHSAGDPYSLSDNRVASIFRDRSGVFWIGTAVGLNKHNPLTRPFRHYRHDVSDPRTLPNPRVRSVFEESSGTLWVGTVGGLGRLDPGAGAFVHDRHDPDEAGTLSNSHVSAILEDHEGSMWFGTPYGGLNRLDRATGRFRHYRHDPADPRSLSSDDVLCLHEDAARRLWVGTWNGGLSRLDRASGAFTHYRHDPARADSLAGDRPFVVTGSRSGGLWVGTWNTGLDLFDPVTGTFTHHRRDPENPGSLHSERIRALHEDDDGTLWIGTDGGGLARRDARTGQFRHYTTRDGLPNDRVLGVLPDDDGHLWLGTGHGLSRFHPGTGTFDNFDVTDGLQGNELNLHAAYRGASGELYFGGNNGLTALRPSEVRWNEHVPPVVLTSLSVLGTEVARDALAADDELVLAHDDNVISFEFAALDFAAPSRNRYAYELEGLSGGWVDLGTQREVTLTHLEPGRYTLRVRGSNNHGRWNEAGLAIALRVTPPYWETWWFRGVAGLGLLALVAGAFLVWTRNIREHNRALRREIDQRRVAERERERLITELEAKNAELERFTYTVSHDLKSPLLTIKGFLGWLRRAAATGDRDRLEHDIGQIEDATTIMHRQLDELLELSRIGRVIHPSENVDLGELSREAVDLLAGPIAERGVEVEIAPDMPRAFGDRVRLLEVFQNLVENAVKFMGEQPSPRVEIGAVRRDGRTVCHVRDNGLGIAPEYHDKVFGLFDRLDPETEGTGIGLALVKRIVEFHGGTIWIESKGAGGGSAFFFELPEPRPPESGIILRGAEEASTRRTE